jgi:hypothetical protein
VLTSGGRRRRLREDERAQAIRTLVCAVLAALLLAAGVAIVLAHAAPRRSGGNGVATAESIGTLDRGSVFCQPGEVLPAGTATLRASIEAGVGEPPPVVVTLRRGGRVLQRTTVADGWSAGGLVVPVRRTTHDLEGVEACFRIGAGSSVTLAGSATQLNGVSGLLDGHPIGDSLTIDYYRPGRESWWSYAGTVARRIGSGRGWPGRGFAWLIAAMTLASLALTGRLIAGEIAQDRPEPTSDGHRGLRAALRRLPATAWVVALIGILNAGAWALMTPPFLVPDEIGHVAYAQRSARPAGRRHREGRRDSRWR